MVLRDNGNILYEHLKLIVFELTVKVSEYILLFFIIVLIDMSWILDIFSIINAPSKSRLCAYIIIVFVLLFFIIDNIDFRIILEPSQ